MSIIKDPLNLEFLNQAKNITVVLPSFQVDMGDEDDLSTPAEIITLY